MDDQAFQRAVRRRRNARRRRTLQALLIAALVFLATGDVAVVAWLAATLGLRVFESFAAERLPERLGAQRAWPWILLGQGLSTASFCAVALILMRQPTPVRLAETLVLLCAICLANARQAAASRPAAVVLVGPPALMLCAAPAWVAWAGAGLPAIDAVLLLTGGGIYTVFVMQLTTAQHREAQALREAQLAADAGRKRWRMTFDHSPTPRICFDASALHRAAVRRPDGRTSPGAALREQGFSARDLVGRLRLIEVNPAARGLLGDDAAGERFDESFAIGFCDALDRMGPDGVLPAFEAELIRDDGAPLVLEAHLRLGDGPAGPWSDCLGAFTDVTQRRLAEIAQDEARRLAEDANRTKSEFLATLTHEIRTPLNGVLGMAQAMEADPLAPAQRERLDVIRRSGASLLALLDDLLDLAQIDAGRLQLAAEPFDLVAAIEAACAPFRAAAADKGLAFRLDVAPELAGRWEGDSRRVRQILANLVSNAVKFTAHGGVTVTAAPASGGVRIEVRDTGIGLAPARAARIFEKFVQLDASPRRAYGGTGLGLAICHELCGAMGGSIGVQSEPGAGARFTVELPLRCLGAALPAVAPPPDPPAGRSGSRPRVLAVDDNAVNRAVLRALLSQLEVEPMLVEDGAEAVRAWETAHWDLILMDVQMPVMDGPTATMTIRAREALLGRARTPIVAVTANTQPHQVASYRAAGMDDVLGKPVNIAELVSVVLGVAQADRPSSVAAPSRPSLQAAS